MTDWNEMASQVRESQAKTPEFAARHNYWNHKNSRSQDRAKELFDKVHVRPLIATAWDIVRTSMDDAEVEDAMKTIERLDFRHNGSNSAKMQAGTLVQKACDDILIYRKDPIEVYDVYLKQYMDYTPRQWDNGKDARDWEICHEVFVDTIKTAVEAIKEACHQEQVIRGEVELKGCLPNNQVPHINRPDYVGVGDLKTKWPRRNDRSKSGKTKASLPNNLSGQFEMNNVYQVAGGWFINNRKPVWLLYVTDSDYQLFHEGNCDELKPEFLEQVVRDQAVHHKVTEKMLILADSKHDLFELVSPDWSHISWSDPPGVIEEAKRIFKL